MRIAVGCIGIILLCWAGERPKNTGKLKDKKGRTITSYTAEYLGVVHYRATWGGAVFDSSYLDTVTIYYTVSDSLRYNYKAFYKVAENTFSLFPVYRYCKSIADSSYLFIVPEPENSGRLMVSLYNNDSLVSDATLTTRPAYFEETMKFKGKRGKYSVLVILDKGTVIQ